MLFSLPGILLSKLLTQLAPSHYTVVVRSTDFEIRLLGLQFWLHHLIAVCASVSHLKTGIEVCTSSRMSANIKCFTQRLVSGKYHTDDLSA